MKTVKIMSILCLAGMIAMTLSCKKGNDVPGQGDETGSYTLAASPKTVEFGWSSPAPQTITVVTNSPDGFTLGQPADWYQVKAEGRNVTFTAQDNAGAARTHDFVITAKGAEDLVIKVSQEEGGKAKEVTYNFRAAGPLDIGWPTANYVSEFNDNVTAGDGWGKFGGHFYAAIDGVATQDKTLPVYKDIYGKAYDASGNEVDWLYDIAFTDNDNGKYTDGTGPEFKIYIGYKANTTGAPRSATIKLFFDDTDAYKVVGTYAEDGTLTAITGKDPIFYADVTQPAN